MGEFLPFFIVLFAAVFFSEIFRRLHLPWVVALIVAGVLLGPSGFDVVEFSGTISFISEIGLVFLMFIAGLEVTFSSFTRARRGVFSVATINALLPFLAGFVIALLFGLSLQTALLMGIIFISSSIAIVIPTLESNGILHSQLGKMIVSATIIVDITSLILLSFFIQYMSPSTSLPLPLFYVSALLAVLGLRWILPRIEKLVKLWHAEKDVFQQELRTVFVMLFGTVIIFELIGLHPIIAGFFSGLVLSEAISSEELKSKIRAISYGIFIPIFFIGVGVDLPLHQFFNEEHLLFFTAVLVAGSISIKFISGYLGGLINKLSTKESALIGVSTIPQLSTTLAVAYAAFEYGFLDGPIITSLVILSIMTTLIAPILVKIVLRPSTST